MEPNANHAKRRPRHRRGDTDDLPLELQRRDRDILKLIYDYRFIPSPLIQFLISGSDQRILRRLQKLFHHGYLDRVIIATNEPFVYALGNKGADELAQFYGIDRGKIDWTTKNREAKERYLDHTLMITRFRATLTLALQNNPDTRILSWVPEGELKDEVMIQGEGQQRMRAPLIPDAFFTLEDQGGEMYFFLEADQSTMTNQRYLMKMKAYFQYWKQGKHKEKHNIESFRVLTITKSEARKENLRKITKEADDRKVGSAMFLFTSEEHYNPTDPASILRPVWQTPKDDTLHHLLE